MKPMPDEINRVAATLAAHYQDLEEHLIILIVSHMMEGEPLSLTDPDAWRVRRLLKVPAFRRDVEKAIQSVITEVTPQIGTTIHQMGMRSIDIIPASLIALAVARNLMRQPTGGMSAKTNRYMTQQNAEALKRIQEMNQTLMDSAQQKYIETVNLSAGLVASGEPVMASLRTAVKPLVHIGLPGSYDARGRRWAPDTTLTMIVRSTWNNVGNYATMELMKDLGIDVIQVSAHLGARPKCFLVQGKMFSFSGENTKVHDSLGIEYPVGDWNQTSYGEPDGILGINCRHHIFPFFDGLSDNTQPEIDDAENREYYKQEQKLRRMERQLRLLRRERNIALGIEDNIGFDTVSPKINAKVKQIEDHVEKHGIKRQIHREKASFAVT